MMAFEIIKINNNQNIESSTIVITKCFILLNVIKYVFCHDNHQLWSQLIQSF